MRIYKAKFQVETCFYSEETNESELSKQAMQVAEEEFQNTTKSLISVDAINSLDDVHDDWIDLVPWLGSLSYSWSGSDPTIREFLNQEGTS